MRVGLVSDTHGLFEPKLRELFAGCDLVLHAGDIVDPRVLDELGRIAPVHAVRGNNDVGPAFDALPEIASVELGPVTALVVHQIGERGRLDVPVRRAIARTGSRVVVYGHSHRPVAALEGDLLLVNPGSAGPRRFSLPRSAGVLEVRASRMEVRIFDVADGRLPLLAPPLVARLGAPPPSTP